MSGRPDFVMNGGNRVAILASERVYPSKKRPAAPSRSAGRHVSASEIDAPGELPEAAARIERVARVGVGAATWKIVAPLPGLATGLKLMLSNTFSRSKRNSKFTRLPSREALRRG